MEECPLYEFGKTGGEEVGFRDPAVFGFVGNTPYYLARESIQNITDNREDSNLPAKAKFDVISIKASEIPESGKLKKIFSECKNSDLEDKECVSFYGTAIDLLNKNSNIRVLKISDYNTTGLTGRDEDKHGNYFLLLKAIGSSIDNGQRGGSHGLGKAAHFVASSFRTEFISSCCGKDNYVFQGKLRLVAHKEDGIMRNNVGFFGLPGQKPIRDLKLIPPIFRRTEKGTDFFILGFNEEQKNWKEEMIKAVIDNYWYSILTKTIEVDVADIKIREDNIFDLMKDYFTEDQKDTLEKPNPWPYFNAFVTDSSKSNKFSYSENLPILGNVTIHILVGENLPKKVAFIRNTGMIIEKKAFPSMLEYSAIFVCDDSQGSPILRKMENYAHNEWKPQNAPEEDKLQCKKAFEELKNFIKKHIKEAMTVKGMGSLPIPGLTRMLNLPGKDTEVTEVTEAGGSVDTDCVGEKAGKETGSEISAKTQQSFIPVPIRIKSPQEPEPEQEPKPESGSKPNPETEPEPSVSPFKRLQNIKYRSFVPKSLNNKTEHVLIIKGPKNTECNLSIKAGTEDAFYKLDITKVVDSTGKEYRAEKNIVYGVKIGPDNKLKLILSFSTNDKYSLNVEAIINKT